MTTMMIMNDHTTMTPGETLARHRTTQPVIENAGIAVNVIISQDIILTFRLFNYREDQGLQCKFWDTLLWKGEHDLARRLWRRIN